MLWMILGCGAPPSSPEPIAAPAPPAPDEVPMETVDVACDVELHAMTDLDVYGQPEKGAQAIGKYPDGTLVRVEGVKGVWARVVPADAGSGLRHGWMGIQMLTTNLRTEDEYPARGRYRSAPKADASKPLPEIASLTVESCRGDWLQVSWEDEAGAEGGGWLSPADHCALPNTTCP